MPNQIQLAISKSADAPLDYEVPNAQEIAPVCLNAVFDGSGAAGSFLPALVIRSDSGHTVSRTFGDVVAAGDTVEVTFLPLAPSPTADPTVVHFNKTPQIGDFLEVQTNTFARIHSQDVPDPDRDAALFLLANGDFGDPILAQLTSVGSGGLPDRAMLQLQGDPAAATGAYALLQSLGTTGPELLLGGSNGNAEINAHDGSVEVLVEATDEQIELIVSDGAGGTQVARLTMLGNGHVTLAGDILTFASGTQQAVVTTLADVIALLQDYGLAA